MSRRAFYPTAEQRGKVEEMIGYGLSEAEICLLFKNPGTGKTIDLRTLSPCSASVLVHGVDPEFSCWPLPRLGRPCGVSSDRGKQIIAGMAANPRAYNNDLTARRRSWPPVPLLNQVPQIASPPLIGAGFRLRSAHGVWQPQLRPGQPIEDGLPGLHALG
jgi:hypothetical protein